MLEFFRILGLVLACVGFILSVVIFIKYKIPKAVAYFTGSENRRIKEYQKRQKEYIKSNKVSSALKNSGNVFSDYSTEALDTDDSFATALLYAESTTMLLDDGETEILE